MSQKVSDLAKNIIKDYEGNQGDIEAHEAMTVRFTSALKYDDLAMLDAISQHYQDTRSNLVSEVLSSITMELFLSLPDHKKEALAKVAEEKCREHEKKNNFTFSGVDKWTFMASEIAKKDTKNA